MLHDRESGKRHRKLKNTMTAPPPHFLCRGGYDLREKKLLDEKIKKRQQKVIMTENTPEIHDPHLPLKDMLTIWVNDISGGIRNI